MAAAVALLAAPITAQTVEWPRFGNDPHNTKYSPLDQIDRTNFDELEIAWTWESISSRVVEANDRVKPGGFKPIPIMLDGLLYVATEVSQVAAIDAVTGKTVWAYDPESWRAGRPANLGFQHRGVAAWSPAAGMRGRPANSDREQIRIFIATHDRRLLALDGKTGEPVSEFGDSGSVDLLADRGLEHFGRRVNPRNITHSSPVAIVGNTVVVGSVVSDGAVRRKAPPGHIRGFDAATGEMKWVFHTIPQQGEAGVETWEGDSWTYTGNTNVWNMMAVDEELGYVYLPTGTPTNDFYGGHRLGDNLYAESIVCLNAETGERVWHFQAVHHGLWDYDFPTPPHLLDITVDGRTIKALAQTSKQAFTYVFDRVTGEPVWPIEERQVPASDVPGERASATQPFPTQPPAFDRQGVSHDDLVDFTPEIKAEAIEIASGYRIGPLFTPPSFEPGVLMLPSAGGGANWPGAAVDPETAILYVPSTTSISRHPLSKTDAARSDLNYTGSFFGSVQGPRGLPLVKPPWGRVTAIDLNKGEHVWMTPNGVGPRGHPALEGLDVPPLLGGGSGSPLLTKALLFVTQSQGMGPENSPRINVFDKANGELLGHIPLPDTAQANPVTYMVGGKQFIVVAVGGGSFLAGIEIPPELEESEPDLVAAIRASSARGTTPQLIALALP
ncbi:MAG: PQQ-binding-like beta-propeller repeat protein [Acidobacteriota bacterium]|nr:PQQ-binding-like beta-propeller repeat protein [Acidobacteriota bacterium]